MFVGGGVSFDTDGFMFDRDGVAEFSVSDSITEDFLLSAFFVFAVASLILSNFSCRFFSLF